MALSTAIYTILYADSTVKGIFSDRIYPGVVPASGSLPCIVYDIGDIQPDNNQTSDSNFDKVQLSVTAISTKYADCETYSENIYTALQRYEGTVASERIDTIYYENQQPGFDPDFSVGNTIQGAGVFTRTLNFTIIRLG